MALGQIDPARLQGDALVRWYLRSPAEIEEERRRAAARSHDAFFSRPRDDQFSKSSPAGVSAAPWTPVGDDLGGNDPQRPRGGPHLAAANSRGFWDYWGYRGCQSCHGYTPETLPPYGGHSPLPPNYSPRSGRSDGASPSRPEWSDKPQCNRQFETDRTVCQKAKSPECWERSNVRLGVCNSTGKVGTPPLRFGPPGR
jgi:hypothetical protein